MSLWYRVFGTSEVQPSPAALIEHLHCEGLAVQPTFRGDDLGWFAAVLIFDRNSTPIHLERFLSTEEGIRAELNTWAAWLETADCCPHHTALMQQMISTRQLFTIRKPSDAANAVLVEKLCTAISRFLATATEGVYQADGQGFYAADGTLLLQEF